MKLTPVLNLAAARPLWSDLCAATGRPLTIDASAVERLGGACLQVLLAAREQWRRDGVDFTIDEPSPAFFEGLRLMSARDLAPTEAGL